MKIKLFLGVIISTLFLFNVSISIALPLRIDFEPMSQEVILGDPAEVALVISGLGDFAPDSISIFDLDITFDPGILKLQVGGVTFGDPVLGDQLDAFDPFNPMTITDTIIGANIVNLFELSLDNGLLDFSQAPTFTLATLTFDTLAVGTSPLLISVNALGDADGWPLYPELGSASITVSPVPEPATILLLVSGMAGLGVFGRKRFKKQKV